MDNLVAKLYESPKTVLTTEDIALIWKEVNKSHLRAKISYYSKHGILQRLTRGIFVKNENYNPRELATSFYIPSYISFETVLRDAGIIFQHYDSIFVAGPWSKHMKIDKYNFVFRRLKDEVLFNSSGVIYEKHYSIAGVERAFLDMVYLFPGYYFDNLTTLSWEKCFELVSIYKNQAMVNRIVKYQKNAK